MHLIVLICEIFIDHYSEWQFVVFHIVGIAAIQNNIKKERNLQKPVFSPPSVKFQGNCYKNMRPILQVASQIMWMLKNKVKNPNSQVKNFEKIKKQTIKLKISLKERNYLQNNLQKLKKHTVKDMTFMKSCISALF